jgi:hypothetical protein
MVRFELITASSIKLMSCLILEHSPIGRKECISVKVEEVGLLVTRRLSHGSWKLEPYLFSLNNALI